MESLSKEKIRELWLSPEFPGHGLGLLAFKHELESRFNVKLSDKLIKSVLVEIPDYLSNISRRKKINRRNYNSVHGFGALMQADVAEFPPYHEFRYVFCAIDVYTQFLWTSVLKNKNSEAIKNAFEAIFKQYPTPDKLEVDQGGEFIRLEKVGYFKSRRIYLHFKREPNKACFVGQCHVRKPFFLFFNCLHCYRECHIPTKAESVLGITSFRLQKLAKINRPNDFEL